MQRDTLRRVPPRPAALAQTEPAAAGMALLGLIEFVLSYTAIYGVIQAPGMVGSLSSSAFSIVAIPSTGPAELAGVLSLTLAVVALIIGLYRPAVCMNRGRQAICVALSTAAAFMMLLMIAGGVGRGLTINQTLSIAHIVAAWVLTVGAIRLALGILAFNQVRRRILILGDETKVERISHRLRHRLGRRYDAVVCLPTLPPHTAASQAPEHDPDHQHLDWSLLASQRLWGVVMASGLSPAATSALLDSKMRGLRVMSGTDFEEQGLGRIDLEALTPDIMLTETGYVAAWRFNAVQRIRDVAISLVMLVMTLPLMLLAALAIKADTAGPVLYRQSRVGKGGRVFTLFKFRSMTADAEATGGPRWALPHDPRITRVGRFIRATRIDELPQLLNIIRGDMSLVGPRPERPHFVAQLAKAIPLYSQRGYVKPGLTGWAQVNYPYGASVEDAREKLAYDLYYLKHRSLWLDLRILLGTVRVVLTREGAR